ncbi:TrbG/VirB9 family P-type conjugative transfer protein [Alcaligenaceae bacterium]|nr:TrbG/VirB9 family P-type conjugative transfer protein [Alcaligenaceae bacterium]
MNRFSQGALAVAMACVLAAPAMALDVPKNSRADHRVRYVDYDPANVIQLDAVIGVASLIVLEDGEEYKFHVFGDSQAYDFTHHANNLFFKPIANDADSNLIVITNKRNYTFRVSYHRDRAARALYKLVIRYPDSQVLQTRQEARKALVQTAFAKVGTPVNWQAYTKSGDLAIAPVHAWDDGHQTWLQFAPNAEIPAVYRVTPDGQEVITNGHMADHRTMVLHRTASRWHLRLGHQVVAIHNEAFGKTPTKPHTGTASPQIQRVVQGAEPQSLPMPPRPPETAPAAQAVTQEGKK